MLSTDTDPKVKVFIDPFGLSAPGSMVVEDNAGYWRTREALSAALRDGSGLTITVRNRSMRSFFDDLANEGGVRLEELDPREHLRLALGVRSLPEEVTQDPRAIVALDLIGLATRRPRYAQEDAEDWLCRVLLGYEWAGRALVSDEQASSLIGNLARIQKESRSPLAIVLRNRRLEMLSGTSARYSGLLRWLAVEPIGRARALMFRCLVRRYPWHEVAQWLGDGDMVVWLAQLPQADGWVDWLTFDLGPAEADGLLPAGVAVRLRRFLLHAVSEGGLQQAVGTMTGMLGCELQVIRETVANRVDAKEAFTAEEAAVLQERFGGRPEAGALLDTARELVPPTSPSRVDPSWDWPRVSDWLMKDYLPFYRHKHLLGALRGTTELVKSFEDWVAANYSELSHRDDCLAHTITHDVARAAQTGAVLLVVVDGLGAEWLPYLKAALWRRGLFSGSGRELALGLLPTVTRVAKPAMLRGQLPGQVGVTVSGSDDYRRLLAVALSLADRDVRLATDLESSVEQLAEVPARVLVFLANKFDEELVHRPLGPMAYGERLRTYLDDLASSIGAAVEVIESRGGQPATVFVTSDHGATDLLRDADMSVGMPTGAETDHGRVVWGDTRFPEDRTLRLDPERFFLPGPATVARGYWYFGQRPQALTHGGVTPQEMAVPRLVMTARRQAAPQALVLTISGGILRGVAANPIRVLLLNPNPYAVTLRGIELRLVEMEVPSVDIPAGGELALEGLLDASGIRTAQAAVEGLVRWAFDQHEESTEVRLSIATGGAAVGDSEFDKMFGD